MEQHDHTHTNTKFNCDQCDHISSTQAHLNQHKRGKHGPGWTADCGAHFDWPMKLNHHNKHCKLCAQIECKKIKKEVEIRIKIAKLRKRKSSA